MAPREVCTYVACVESSLKLNCFGMGMHVVIAVCYPLLYSTCGEIHDVIQVQMFDHSL